MACARFLDPICRIGKSVGGTLYEACRSTVLSGRDHPEPTIFITDALAYLCEGVRSICQALGSDIGNPPQPIGAAWVTDTIRFLTPDDDDDDDADFSSLDRFADEMAEEYDDLIV